MTDAIPVILGVLSFVGFVVVATIQRRASIEVTERAAVLAAAARESERADTARAQVLERAVVTVREEAAAKAAGLALAVETADRATVEKARLLEIEHASRMAWVDQLQADWQSRVLHIAKLDAGLEECREREAILRVEVAEARADATTARASADACRAEVGALHARIDRLETTAKETP